MESDFRIQLSATLDFALLNKNIQSFFNSKIYKIKVEADTSALKNINVTGDSSSTAKGTTSTASAATKASNAIADLTTKIKNLVTQNKLGSDSAAYFNQELSSIEKTFEQTKNIDDFSKSINRLRNKISESSVSFQEQTKDWQESSRAAALLAKQTNSVRNQYNSLTQALVNARTQGQITEQQFDELSQATDEIFNTYEAGAGSVDKIFTKTENGFKGIRNQLSGLKAETAAHSQDLSKIIVKYAKWLGIATLVSTAINAIKQMISQVVSLDNAMVELNKVYDATNAELNEVKKQAFDLASALGRTGEEVINATTEFKRMGYTIEESLDLAKVAVTMTNVAEGITDTGEAAKILTSILKGTNTDVKYAQSLLDRLNNISNNSAVSFDALASMTQEAAATMKILGNNLDETMGLLTGAYAVLQDESVANGIQTIGLRIAGLNEDLESEVGLSNQVIEALEKYANVKAFDEQTNQLKSTYQILEEVAQVWEDIDKNQQTALLNQLAGKRQADVAAAILNNWEDVSKAVELAANSMGSAQKEQEAYLNSIQGKVAQFKNVFQEFSDLIIGSDLVKAVVDIGTAIAKIALSVVNIAAQLLKMSGFSYTINFLRRSLEAIGAFISEISDLITYINEQLQPIRDFIDKYLNFGWLEDLIKQADKANDAYSDLAESFDENGNLVSEYDTQLNKVVNTLSNLNSIFSDTVQNLKDENEQLQNQEELEQKLLSVEKAREELAQAKNKRIRVFRAGKGFVYESDESEVQTAQENLTSTINDLQDFKYELILSRAEQFSTEFSSLLSGDKEGIIEGWEELFEKFQDLVGTELGGILKTAEEQFQEFLSHDYQTKTSKELRDNDEEEKTKEDTVGDQILGALVPGFNKHGEFSWGELAQDLLNPVHALGSLFGFYANGTESAKGGLSIVGEEGPELRVLNKGDGIIPTDTTQKLLNMANGNGGGSSVSVGTVVINEPNNFDGFVSQFCSKLNIPEPAKI